MDLPYNAKEIEFAPGYFVTRDGRVFSTKTNWRGYGIRELMQGYDSNGYPIVTLKLSDRERSFRVHRLVAIAFLTPPTPEHCVVRHLDGSRTNNDVSNLAWGTPAENAADRDLHGRTERGEAHWTRRHPEAIARGSRNGNSKLVASDVLEIRKLKKEGNLSKAEIAAKFNVSVSCIKSIVSRKRWNHL